MTEQLHVHQCPYCELHFSLAYEVKDHILHDHEEHAAGYIWTEPRELPPSG